MYLYHNPRKVSIATIAALDVNGLVYVEHMPRTVDSEVFIGFLKNLAQVLGGPAQGPTQIPQDTILILDNAKPHVGVDTYKYCEDEGIMVLTLPAYSPELQPVEKLFLSLKAKNQAKLAELR